ncbi:MAG: LamG domain-containing protein [Lentisphaerales bacterium]|nr:LamG domain-containing protein [Lentisphaerales bacterium]
MRELSDKELELLESYCNESISDEDFKELEQLLLNDEEFRKEARTYFAFDSNLHLDEEDAPLPFKIPELIEFKTQPSKSIFWPLALAASLSFIAGIGALSIFSDQQVNVEVAQVEEVKASGFAVIDKLVDVKWASSSKSFNNGYAIGQDKLMLEEGIIHLEFFCGASVIIEGPAESDIQSSWQGFCHKGKLRANVPPAAHGFRIDTPKSKIIDLGTEFGINVDEEEESVVVFDGEIELHSKQHDMKLLTEGKGIQTQGDNQTSINASDPESFIQTASLENQHLNKIQEKYAYWKKNSQQWATDPRLISYYNFEHENSAYVRNININSKDNLDGKIIRAERVNGRWSGVENGGALEFKKPGSRARVNIPGIFSNFTFSAWVRIDSLNRDWNSLFMGDSYQPGEPHWQINEDGGLVICIKVLDRPKNYHYLYKSKPIWDASQSGEWIHLATVYSPEEKMVRHYKNGEVVYSRQIDDEWLIKDLKIGPAEIGNWGLPTRTDPEFALRNINGRIDELMLFDAPLSSEEIKKIYEIGKPIE